MRADMHTEWSGRLQLLQNMLEAFEAQAVADDSAYCSAFVADLACVLARWRVRHAKERLSPVLSGASAHGLMPTIDRARVREAAHELAGVDGGGSPSPVHVISGRVAVWRREAVKPAVEPDTTTGVLLSGPKKG